MLSGGKKLRITIARSIASEPRILLLDEATSALDPHAETVVQKALNEASKDRATIIITHKLKTIQAADNIIVIKKGRIVEQGNHEELLARGGAYLTLVKAQDLFTREKAAEADFSDEEAPKGTELQPVKPALSRQDTRIRDNLMMLSQKEDYSLAPASSIIVTVAKLVGITPQLKSWYLLCLLSCIAGGMPVPYPQPDLNN